MKDYLALNEFLVGVFRDILRIEERTLTSGEYSGLSMREMHVIESVCSANRSGRSNRITDVAQEQGVTPGTLTVAVNSLVRKGYMVRRQDEKDRRIVRLYATERGEAADAFHGRFHRDMVRAVTRRLNEEELNVLVRALEAIRAYFEEKNREEAWR